MDIVLRILDYSIAFVVVGLFDWAVVVHPVFG